MVVFKETANISVVPVRISTYPLKHRRLRFPFQFLQCQRPPRSDRAGRGNNLTRRSEEALI